MKKVILYCRVSTEDQGDSNSPDYQESRLKEYCRLLNYEVFQVILDKKSGKNFNRPGWKEIRNICRDKANKIDMVLFLRWDRYARNIGLAINEIDYFKKLKVELNSCEQPLDQTNPNSIVLLSMYLSLPEAERNNISLRTSECTYEAQLKGKCTHRAPKGYLNYHISEKEKAVKIDPDLCQIVKWSFEEAAKGIKSVELIRREASLKGLKLGKSSFPEMLKNKFYIGQVYVKAWKDKPSQWVKGLHTPLINIETFNKIQELHFGKKIKKTKLLRSRSDDFYLRRFLVCPHCGKGLAGCYSHGNGGEYPYYKCPNCNRFNANATKANNSFIKYINTLKPRPEILKLYSEVFADINSDASKDVRKAVADAVVRKETEKNRIQKIDIDYIDGKMDRDN